MGPKQLYKIVHENWHVFLFHPLSQKEDWLVGCFAVVVAVVVVVVVVVVVAVAVVKVAFSSAWLKYTEAFKTGVFWNKHNEEQLKNTPQTIWFGCFYTIL